MARPRKRRERHFPAEEMPLTAMATVHMVAGVLRTNVHHLTPCVDSQNPSQPPCRRSPLEIYSPAALLLMSLSAHYKQIAQGVLSAESGTHECQSAGAIPTHPSQTDLILVSEIAPFYVFYLLPDTFSAQLLVRRFGWCSRVEYAAK